MDISEQALKFIERFLENRCQCVILKGYLAIKLVNSESWHT